MEISQDLFRKRLKEEIQHLEHKVLEIPEEERPLVEGVIALLEQDLKTLIPDRAECS